MPPSFNEIPSNLRIPFVAIEFDPSQARPSTPILAYRVLLMGQKIAGGTMTANTLYRVTSAEQVLPLAGEGSQLHLLAKAYFKVNKFTETWIIGVADDGSGVAAAGAFTVTGPATANGTLYLYIGGELVKVAVLDGDTATEIGEAVEAAINAVDSLPVTAINTAGAVALTAKNKGTAGNTIDLRVNYQTSEILPAGVAVAVTPMASGATDPDLDTAIAALGDIWYNVIAHPWGADATSLTSLEEELTRRFGPMVQAGGVAISAAIGDFSTLATLGETRNSPHSCIVEMHEIPSACYSVAGAVAAQVAFYGAIDPARPFQTLALPGVLPPLEADRFTNEERNLLLYSGISTTKAGAGGVLQIERLITTYRKNPANADDMAYLRVNTMLTLAYLRWDFRNYFATKYPRHKLADDGNNFGPGQPIMTPKLGKAEAVARARAWESIGLVEDVDGFAASLICERASGDPDRLDFLIKPTLVGQLVVTGVQIGFLLQRL